MEIALRAVDFFLHGAGRLVVFVDAENLLAALEGVVEARGVVKALGLGEELLHPLDVATVLRRDGAIVIRRVFEMGEDDDGLLAARIVAVVGDDAQGVLRVGVAALGDPLFRQLATRVAKALERAVIGLPGERGVRDDIARRLVESRGLFVVPDFHRPVAVFDRLLPTAFVFHAAAALPLRCTDHAAGGEGNGRCNKHRGDQQRGDRGGEWESGHGCDGLVGSDRVKMCATGGLAAA